MMDFIFLSLITLILLFLLLYIKISSRNDTKNKEKDKIPSMDDISPDDPYAIAKERYIHARGIIEKNKDLISKEDLRDLKFLAEINPNGQLLMQKEYDIFFRKFEEIKDKVNMEHLKKIQEKGMLGDISDEELTDISHKENISQEVQKLAENISHINDNLDENHNHIHNEMDSKVASK